MNMNYSPLRQPLWSRVRGMFNLNDPRWGRKDDEPNRPEDADSDNSSSPQDDQPWRQPEPPRQQGGGNQGPPDLDELWRDFNRKLNGLFGGQGGRGGRGGAGGSTPPYKPDPKTTGIGVGLIGSAAILIWLGTGFFIVQEGQQAVITQFGKYHTTVGAGFNWRLPYPVQRHESVFVTQIRSVDVGRDTLVRATGLRDSAMLTRDENIVEIKFAVQYRLSDARDYLFNSRDPDAAVLRAAETAVREVVGSMRMDAALVEERDQIGPRMRTLMQSLLDRYVVGIEIVGVNLQQGGVRPPEQVQAAFDDVIKAGQERERAKNEAEAYANDVIPRARGTASRLVEEAEGYKARVVAQSRGDSERFRLIQTEHAKAPQVMRERLYLETMQEVYSNVSKVLIDTRQNSNLLYLPLDKILQGGNASAPSGSTPANANNPMPLAGAPNVADARAREDARARTRETR